MAAQIGVSFRINKELKEDFEDFCDSVGLSMSAAIILFIKAAVREQRIPFEVTALNQSHKNSNHGKRGCRMKVSAIMRAPTNWASMNRP